MPETSKTLNRHLQSPTIPSGSDTKHGISVIIAAQAVEYCGTYLDIAQVTN